MKIIRYDGNFDGFLCVLFYCYKEKIIPENIVSEGNFSLFGEEKEINTETKKSKYFFDYLRKNIDDFTLKKIFFVFSSKNKIKDITIFKYLISYNKYKKDTEKYINLEHIKLFNDLYGKVAKEVHLLKGILRFRKMTDGSYYAPISPDNDVSKYLLAHFSERYSEEIWIIHDLKRKTAYKYENKKIDFFYVEDFQENKIKENYDSEEKEIQLLWKKFHESIAIKNRKNLKLQKNLMPYRYWKYLIEI